MMDFVTWQYLAKDRYNEMLEDAAEWRRASAYAEPSNGLGVMNRLNNVLADLKFRPRNARRATTRI